MFMFPPDVNGDNADLEPAMLADAIFRVVQSRARESPREGIKRIRWIFARVDKEKRQRQRER